MPRSLARLKFKLAPFVRPRGLGETLTRAHVRNRVPSTDVLRKALQRESAPGRRLNLTITVNQEWKTPRPSRKREQAPHTVRDIVDPERKARTGELIYIFRNTKSNQTIYSLGEMLDNHHLKQLPFLGRHSKPPVLRPDEWVPHCVVRFKTSEQGHNAFRKLREFRKLHEVYWDKTNPEWKKLKLKQRMNRIMDQTANTSADLARVLQLQADQGVWQQGNLDEQQKIMDERWPEVLAVAEAATSGEQEKDTPKWLLRQIFEVARQLGLKRNQKEEKQERLRTTKRSYIDRLTKINSAVRMAKDRTIAQEKLEPLTARVAEVAPWVEQLQTETAELEENFWVREPMPLEKKPSEQDEPLKLKRLRALLKKSRALEEEAKAREAEALRAVLDGPLKKELPAPFSPRVDVMWADLHDAEYARGHWPPGTEHDVLNLRGAFADVAMMRRQDFDAKTEAEVRQLQDALQKRFEPDPEPEVEEKQEPTGIWKYIPESMTRNPFRRAEAS
ncbi:transcriptional regulation of mitochondrial recombination-domain-containing protein [Massariosphaeria phaeospora]|uniref:Large ribosomal subunit protein mL67 n=1 Tax=Massariosphaeria phaeospora TaxID=100035 RepID=A0A7C8I4V7_9PLEO|nr:transcriptional regulation of mitochondrial recombination-domain-containing protein [Massariosphaeria phaeospora]